MLCYADHRRRRRRSWCTWCTADGGRVTCFQFEMAGNKDTLLQQTPAYELLCTWQKWREEKLCHLLALSIDRAVCRCRRHRDHGIRRRNDHYQHHHHVVRSHTLGGEISSKIINGRLAPNRNHLHTHQCRRDE